MKDLVIAGLTRGYEDVSKYSELIERNKYIFSHLSEQKVQADVVILHEGNITKEHQIYISEKSNGTLIFTDVKNSGPKSAFDDNRDVINQKLCPPTSISNSFPLGYKHMCMFWSIDFLDYFSEYKYLIRVDEDCLLQSIKLSIIDYMQKSGIRFSSPFWGAQDIPPVVMGLDELRIKFLKKHNLPNRVSFEQILTPYTNLMIVDLEYFRHNEIVQAFLKEVDRCGGIYSNRWGDSPIWGVISTFFDGNIFIEDKHIEYYHGSHTRQINGENHFIKN